MTDTPTLLLSNEELYDLIVVGLLNSNERLVLLGDARTARVLLAQALAALEDAESYFVQHIPSALWTGEVHRLNHAIAALRAAGVETVK